MLASTTSHERDRTEQESHKPWDEAVSGPLEDIEESSKEWHANNEANRPAFQEVCDE
jgi:hypothetical protein